MNMHAGDAAVFRKSLLGSAFKASLLAGDATMQMYISDSEVAFKPDNSPVTEADRRSHAILAAQLGDKIPLLSEEGAAIAYEERKDWDLFWLIDPLDGTKEFIKRNGEFTVNIALMERNRPIFGIVYLPAKGELFFGDRGLGAHRIQRAAVERLSEVKFDSILETALENSIRLPGPVALRSRDAVRIVQSIDHVTTEEAAFIERLKIQIEGIETTSAGSSLKFCRVAEGRADLYPRFGPTMEWDTAAGQCIAESAGCEVFDLMELSPIRYNRRILRNGPFMVIGQRFGAALSWKNAALSCARSCVSFSAAPKE
jgi:3'(2'), 5'-bisphosphate nucleotidase